MLPLARAGLAIGPGDQWGAPLLQRVGEERRSPGAGRGAFFLTLNTPTPPSAARVRGPREARPAALREAACSVTGPGSLESLRGQEGEHLGPQGCRGQTT